MVWDPSLSSPGAAQTHHPIHVLVVPLGAVPLAHLSQVLWGAGTVSCVCPQNQSPGGHVVPVCYLFAEARGLPLQVLVAPGKARRGDVCVGTHTS